MARVDETIVQRLAMTLLSNANGAVTVLSDGQADPVDVDAWARLVKAEVSAMRRVKGNTAEPDQVGVTMTVNVWVRAARLEATTYALMNAMAYVAQYMGEQWAIDSDTGHAMFTERAECKSDAFVNAKAPRGGVVTVTGFVTRTSGSGILNV